MRRDEAHGLLVSCSVNFGARCTRWWPLAHERVYKLALKNGLRVVRRGSTWFFLLPFLLLPFANPSLFALLLRFAPVTSPLLRSESENRVSRTEKKIGANLSGIGKNRANPRATGRWTTWKHVASGIAAPKSGGKRNGRRAERARGEIERSRFLGTRRTNTDPTKRFRSFDIPKPLRSYSFCRPSASAPSTALKRRVFAHRDRIAN